MIELTGEVFDREGSFLGAEFEFRADRVDLGLGENQAAGFGKFFIGKPSHVVALEDAQASELREPERLVKVVEEVTRFSVKAGLFFDENAVHQEQARILGNPAPRARRMGYFDVIHRNAEVRRARR